MNRKIILLAAMAAAAFLSAGCKNKELEALNSVEKDRFLVKTERAAARNLSESILLAGSVKALDEATLYPRVAGKLLKNLLKEGDSVKRDQAVALIERDEVGVVYEPAPVPSTLTGVVGRIYQDVGAHVTLQTPIALVVNQEQMRIKLEVPERYISKIFINQPANITVDAYPGKVFKGKIYKISPVVDSDTRAAPVEVLADNPSHQLNSGMFAQVNLVVGEKANAVSVSASSVQQDEKGASYLFLPKNGSAVRRNVSVGLKTVDFVEISSGVAAGEEVINFGLYGLQDGSKIEITK